VNNPIQFGNSPQLLIHSVSGMAGFV
jgi:hypothetical protein